jgi:3-dehydroquinate synthase
MKLITVDGLQGKSQIFVGETLGNVGKYLPESNVLVITDNNVKHHHQSSFPQFPVYSIDAGERSKNLEEVADIYRWLLSQGADRTSFILGIGGGVVCDIAGFVASTYMRGVKFGFVATSLLAQVDASIGGKNGVDFDGYKNIVGTFNQPQFVICDTAILSTLAKDEIINGYAEILKHTLIADAQMFHYIECRIDSLKQFDPVMLMEFVVHSVSIKAKIVQTDENEKNERKKLNLGHTWGHAIEKISGMSHGKSISIGLEFAARLSVEKGLLKKKDYLRIINVLRELDLPVCSKINPFKVFEALKMDKKKTANSIDFILMNGVGNVVIERITLDEIHNFIQPKPNYEN